MMKPSRLSIASLNGVRQPFKRANGGCAMNNEDRSKKINRYTSDRGISLLEVLLAATILSVGFLGTGVLAMGVMTANKTSREVTVATALAQDKMEEVRQSGYSGLPSVTTTVTEDYGTIVGSVDGNTADYADYKRVTETQVGSPAAGMKTVEVSVYRLAGQSPVVFTTIVSD